MLERRAEQIVILFPEVFLYLLKGAQRSVFDLSFSLFGLVYFPFFGLTISDFLFFQTSREPSGLKSRVYAYKVSLLH